MATTTSPCTRAMPAGSCCARSTSPWRRWGRKEKRFASTVLGIVRKHAPDFDAATMELRPSRQGTYLSVTCTIRATSREQLDALYRDLCDHPSVVMVL
jgi:putative lipoic acid-binding regulatory protein